MWQVRFPGRVAKYYEKQLLSPPMRNYWHRRLTLQEGHRFDNIEAKSLEVHGIVPLEMRYNAKEIL